MKSIKDISHEIFHALEFTGLGETDSVVESETDDLVSYGSVN